MAFSQEAVGTILVLFGNIFYGMQPVAAKVGSGIFSPVFFAAAVTLIAALFFIVLAARKGKAMEILSWKRLPVYIAIAFFGSVWTFLFLFYGSQLTSGVNTSILLRSDTIYAFLLSWIFLRERITKMHIIATIITFAGVLLVVFRGTLEFNAGDIFILLVPLGWQISHTLVKHHMGSVDHHVLAAARYFYAFFILLSVMALTGAHKDATLLSQPENISFLLFYGLVIQSTSSLTWYEAIRRINLSKASALIAPYPAIGVMLSLIFLGESATASQLLGLVLTIAGVAALSLTKSEKRK